MKVSIIGAGRIGLALGACLADKGHRVLFTDRDPDRLKALARGEAPFYEPGLQTLLRRNKALIEWTEAPLRVVRSRVIFLTVSLPVKAGGDFDLSGVEDWVRQIRSQTQKEKILVLKSTLPPGTGRRLQSLAQQTGAPLYTVTCPEFLRQGRAVRDIRNPERIVIGGLFPKINKKVARLYKTFSRGSVIFTSPETAEVGKLSANAFLALKISFINLTADLAEGLSADINDLREILGSDSRIGKQFLQAGLGFGGSCLPKDLKHLIFQGRGRRLSMDLFKAVEALNRRRADHFFSKIKQREKNLTNKTYALWGLSFKPGTDDVRYSPAVFLAQKLLKSGAGLNIFDPLFQEDGLSGLIYRSCLKVPGSRRPPAVPRGSFVLSGAGQNKLCRRKNRKPENRGTMGIKTSARGVKNNEDSINTDSDLKTSHRYLASEKVVFHKSPLSALKSASGLIVGTDCPEFRKIPLKNIKTLMKTPFIADGRGIFDPRELKKEGFVFYQAGVSDGLD